MSFDRAALAAPVLMWRKGLIAILAAGACLAFGTVVEAYDTVKTAKANISGRVVGTNTTTVTIEPIGKDSAPREIPVNEIVAVLYEGEPPTLRTARTYVLSGRYEDALTALEKLTLDHNVRKGIAQDVDFYQAFCSAQLALRGNGELAAAGKEMSDFVNQHKDSYHWLLANEIVGDLLVATGKADALGKAEETYYARVAQAPWADYKMRAGVAIGRALLAQGKSAEAEKAFNGVLAIAADDELAQAQQLAATVGNARVLALQGKSAEAIKTAEAVVAKAGPEQTDLMAQAYNALGTAHRAAGRTNEALLAFLRVDLLYSSAPEAHAEALYNLAQLWEEVRKPDRAARARQTLLQQYKNSPWARKIGQ